MKGQAVLPRAAVDPEYVRVADVKDRFGLPKSTTYLLARTNQIESSRIPISPGSKKWVLLLSVPSLRKFIERHSKQEAA